MFQGGEKEARGGTARPASLHTTPTRPPAPRPPQPAPQGPLTLHGLEGEVDVMIEAKCKERALLALRDGLPIPEPSGGEGGEGEED